MPPKSHKPLWIVATLAVLIGGGLWYFSPKRGENPTAESFAKSADGSRSVSRTVSKHPGDVEAEKTAKARPCERTVLTYLDLSRPPSQQELIAAGNLGEALTPTRDAEPSKITDTKQRLRQQQDNLAFGTAIQAWNQHRYEQAYQLFENHLSDFADGPWAAESALHLGCFCQYNGRLAEAAERFEQILSSTDSNSEMHHKAKLRRSILHLDQGNLDVSLKGFTEMKQNDPDPAHQTYASYWIREISLLKKNETALRDCGQKALARVAEIAGQMEVAASLREMMAAGPHGFTAGELHATALANGMDSNPVRADAALDDLPLPFVAHYKDRHYVTVEKISDGDVRLYDSRVGEVKMPRSAFMKQWSGFALIFRQPATSAAIHPAENLDDVVGGCCGHPRSPSDLGDKGSCNKNCGMPGWSVNPVNFNFMVSDTPMWWEPPVGPTVEMSLLFNSLDPLNNYEFFGEKWSFEYASYLLIPPGTQVQVRDGDGRLETFTAPVGGGGTYPITYTTPAGDFRTLTETGDHVFTLTHQDGHIYHYGIPAAMAGTSSVPLLLSIADRHGNTLSITHNAHGAIVSIGHSMLPPLDGIARLWNFIYDTINGHYRVTRIDDPFGRSASFSYDDDGNLRNQTDMGGLAYGYDYTTKLSLDTIGTDRSAAFYATPGNPATEELFISAIRTPKGKTIILTEPSDGDDSLINITPEQQTQGYSSLYPPIGSPTMWTNYRIRITNPEDKTEEYFFDGSTVLGYHRDAIQLNRAPDKSVAPTSGAKDRYFYNVIGGVKGKITSATRYDSEGREQTLHANNYSSTTLKRTAITYGDSNWTSYKYNTNGTLETLILPKTNDYTTDPYKIHYIYEVNGLDLDKTQRYFNGILKTLIDLDYWPGTRDVKHSTNALGQITTYTWKLNGLPSTITDNTSGEILTFVYDDEQIGHPTDGNATWRLKKIFKGSESNGTLLMDIEYDLIGRPVMEISANGDSVQNAYDNLNRLTRNDFSDGTFTEQIWECCYLGEIRSGKLFNDEDRIEKRTKYIYDRRGLLVRSIDTAGKITQFSYDDTGRMVSLIDPMGRKTIWTYDQYGRLDKKIYPDSTFEKTTWANMFQPKNVRNRLGQLISYDFDYNNNLVKFYGPDFNIIIVPDVWDRIYTIKDTFYSSAVHTYDYDLLGRVTSIDGPWTDDTLSYNYNDATRTTTRTSPGGITQTIITDALDRLASLVNPLGTYTPGYDGDSNRPLTITHSGGFNTAFTYHGAELDKALASITSRLPNGNAIGIHTYGYDNQSRIKSWQRDAPLANPSGTTRSYHWNSYYDFASQLTTVAEKSIAGVLQGGWDYQYDPAGNITSMQNASGISSPSSLTRRTHNSLNQLTSTGGGGNSTIRGTLSEPGKVSIGLNGSSDKPARMLADNRFETDLPLVEGANSLTATAMDGNANRSDYVFSVNVASQSPSDFDYDDNGNLLSDGVRSYVWDGLSRLKKIIWTTGKTTEFKYNALGQRCERIETNGTTVTNSYYLFDGIQMIDRRSGTIADTATIDRRYFYQGEQRKNGTNWDKYYYCRDHLGSIREVVKSVSGANTLVARYDYDPYGKRSVQYQASGYVSDLGYTGHVTHPSLVAGQSEMVLTHYRAYDPQLGVWLSADPLGEEGGINLYGYVGGAPLSIYDPLGLDWMDNTSNFFAGFADNTTFGLASKVREGMLGSMGIEGDGADHCSGSYNGGEWVGTGVSLAIGGAGAAQGLAKAGSSSLRKQLYEIGQKTLTNRQYSYFASRNADPIRRGIDIVRHQGWTRAGLPSPLGLLSQGWKTGASTGLTPLAADSLGAAAATGFGVGSASYNSFKPSECP